MIWGDSEKRTKGSKDITMKKVRYYIKKDVEIIWKRIQQYFFRIKTTEMFF
jgi:hypothetical protein